MEHMYNKQRFKQALDVFNALIPRIPLYLPAEMPLITDIPHLKRDKTQPLEYISIYFGKIEYFYEDNGRYYRTYVAQSLKTPLFSLDMDKLLSVKEKAKLQALTPFEISKLTDYFKNYAIKKEHLARIQTTEISQTEFVAAPALLKKGALQAQDCIKADLLTNHSSPPELLMVFMELVKKDFCDTFLKNKVESLYQLCVYQDHYKATPFSIKKDWTDMELTEPEKEHLVKKVLHRKIGIETLLTLGYHETITQVLSQFKNRRLSYYLLKLSFYENMNALNFFDNKVIALLKPFYQNILTLTLKAIHRGLGIVITDKMSKSTMLNILAFKAFLNRFLETAELSALDKENFLFSFYTNINHHYTKKFVQEKASVIFFNKKKEFFDTTWYQHIFSLLANKSLPLYLLNHVYVNHKEAIQEALLSFSVEKQVLIVEQLNKLFSMNRENKKNAQWLLTDKLEKEKLSYLFNNQHLYFTHQNFLKSSMLINGLEQKKEYLLYYSFVINKPVLTYKKVDKVLQAECLRQYLLVQPVDEKADFSYERTFFIKEKQFMVVFALLDSLLDEKGVFPALVEKQQWLGRMKEKTRAMIAHHKEVSGRFSEIFKRKIF